MSVRIRQGAFIRTSMIFVCMTLVATITLGIGGEITLDAVVVMGGLWGIMALLTLIGEHLIAMRQEPHSYELTELLSGKIRGSDTDTRITGGFYRQDKEAIVIEAFPDRRKVYIDPSTASRVLAVEYTQELVEFRALLRGIR